MSRLASLPVLLATLIACQPVEEAPLGPDVTTELTRQGGCADLVLYAADQADTLALHAQADGLIEATPWESDETTYELTFPSSLVSLDLTTGQFLTEATCNDDVEHLAIEEAVFEVVGGTGTLVVRPNALVDDSPRVDLVVDGLVFEDAAGTQLEVTSLSWTNVAVGWFPG